MAFEWYRLPRLFGLIRLFFLREKMRRENLVNTEPALVRRTPEGIDAMGAAEARFGRNVPLKNAYPDQESLLSPNPRLVSNRLLARDEFKPATILNLLAAAWIQFQVHDWFSHGKNEPDRPFEVDVEDGDGWTGERPMKIRRTRVDPTRESHLPPTYRNAETHWWDGSQLYGSREELQRRLRSHEDGKLKVEADGFLPLDPEKGVDLTGVNDNWWVGLTLLHTLFAREHNEICDMLKAEYPTWSDQRLYDHARLINAALMTKIHTTDWTPAILPNRNASSGVRSNWWGLLGESLLRIRRRRHSGLAHRIDILTGVPGSLPEQHAAPYSLTEEFVAVYRMHPLIPDELEFRSIDSGRELNRTLQEVTGRQARSVFESMSMEDVFYSFGISHPGALRLRNFPNSLRSNVRPDGRLIDLAAIDILRDRERGVPRYNDFRELLHKPRLKSFEELTDDADLVEAAREVYDNDIDRVDTMVGLLAEPLPRGFGFSETAFRVFLLMASRRLKSDRFYTVDYRPEIYTQVGIDWVENNDMTTVLLRHFPALEPALRNVKNAFAPWNRV